MQLLFESWRAFCNTPILEIVDRYRSRSEEIETDLGSMFPSITLEKLVAGKYTDIQEKAIILAVLDLFVELETEAADDLSDLKSKLKTIRIMSGNSPEFTFLSDYDSPTEEAIKKGKNRALQLYLTPHKLPASPGEEKTKSLKDWHEHLKVVWSNPRSNAGEVERSRAIKAFHGDSPTEKPLDTPQAEVDVSGETWVNPLRPFRQHMTRGRP